LRRSFVELTMLFPQHPCHTTLSVLHQGLSAILR
jgi:hypothetical protein